MLNSAPLSRETLAAALEQSADCVKLVSLAGDILWMNANGQCAMEIDDFAAVEGQQWASLWPIEARELVAQSLAKSRAGAVAGFDAFCPTARGAPRWWSVSVTLMKDENGDPSGFLSISRDITPAEKSRQALQLAANEMRHRLSNTLAVVGALMIGFARGTPEREAFAAEMQKRLIALDATQRLFAREQGMCRIDALITALTAPFEGSTSALTLGVLPPSSIDREQADAISLVIGELAVNSIKHGALGKSGSVHINVADTDGELTVTWTETLDDRVVAHSRPGGQGLSLIRDIVVARGGRLSIDWHDYGLTATIAFRLPAETGDFAIQDAA